MVNMACERLLALFIRVEAVTLCKGGKGGEGGEGRKWGGGMEEGRRKGRREGRGEYHFIHFQTHTDEMLTLDSCKDAF